jgi:hypothetical protein
LKSRDADGVEGLVIGALGVADADGGYSEIFQWLNPLCKNGGFRDILL